mgnify:CR=1 FL=1
MVLKNKMGYELSLWLSSNERLLDFVAAVGWLSSVHACCKFHFVTVASGILYCVVARSSDRANVIDISAP